MFFVPRKLLGVLVFSSILSLFFLFNLAKPSNATTASSNSTCLSSTVVSEAPLGGSAYQSLGLDITTHPEILKYRIQWFSGSWSPWYVPGQDDVDWKTNTDGSQRRVWAYFDDHTHEYEKCSQFSCTDSDNGQNFNTKGTTSGVYGNSNGYSSDYCSTGGQDDKGNPINLTEFYCIDKVSYGAKGYFCPNGCQDGACLPGVQVLSPNNGGKWEVGKTYPISWNSVNINDPYAAIYLVPAQDISKAVILAQPYLSANSYNYTVRDPAEFSNHSSYFQAGNQFKILICAGAVYTHPNCSYADSSDTPFTIILPAPTPSKPVISNIKATEIISTSALIKFSTDRAVTSSIWYGPTDTVEGRNFRAYNNVAKVDHAITLTSLLPNTTYYYRVTVIGDSTGTNNTESASYSFKTLAPPVEKKPDLTIKDIYTGYSSNASVIKVKYCNEGNSQPLVSGYPATFYIKMTANGKTHTGTSDNTNYVVQVPGPGNCQTLSDYPVAYFNLTAGQSYSFVAEADWQKTIAESNETNNVLSKFVELPMYLIGIIVENITATSATVKWTTAFLADSHVDYVSYGGSIYSIKNAKDTNFVLAHSLALTGLNPNTIYSYSLFSYDQQGNIYATKSLSSSELGLNFKTLLPPPIESKKPDLTITDVTISGTPKVGDYSLGGKVTIKNIGTAKAQFRTNDIVDGRLKPYGLIGVYLNGLPGGANSVQAALSGIGAVTPWDESGNTIAPGESKQYIFSTMQDENIRADLLGSAGQKNLYFIVDEDNEVVELNENNNSLTKTVTIGAATDRKPDLTVKDIYYENGLLKVKYCNEGIGESGAMEVFYLKMTANGKTHTGKSGGTDYGFLVPVPGICKNTDGYPISYFNIQQSGFYGVLAEIDWENSISESNENNNTLTKTVTVGAATDQKPDLIPTTLEIKNLTHPDNSLWLQYDILEIVIGIKNIGSQDTGEFYYTVLPDQSNGFIRSNILSLKAGESYTFKHQPAWDRNVLTKQDITFTLKVDSGNDITESNEANNTLAQTITIADTSAKPDLLFTKDITVDKSTILPGDTVTFSVDAKNNSEVAIPAGAFLKWYIAGNEYKSCNTQLGTLNAGWTSGFGCTVNNFQDITGDKNTGTVHVQVKIDSENIVVEANESNNKMEKYIYVGSTDTSKTCVELRAGDSTKKYFDICKAEGYGFVCFDKHSGEYKGCGKTLGDGCTVNNVQAIHNISCSVSTNTDCTDSDGGKDYYVKGKSTGLYSNDKQIGWIFGEDSNKASGRYDSTLNYSIHYDHCFDSATSKQLNEGYCDVNGILQAEGITCSYGCKDGACLTTSAAVSLSYDSSTPISRDISVGSTNIGLVNYRISVDKGVFNLPTLTLDLDTSKASINDVEAVYVYKAGVLIGTGKFNSSGRTSIGLATVIPNGTSQVWEIKAEISKLAVIGHQISLGMSNLSFPTQPEFNFTQVPLGWSNPMTVVSATTSTCIDSDGGANYHTKGWCTDALGAHEDNCVAVDASGRSNKCLTEYYCNKSTQRCDQAKGGEFECAFGCSENACIMKKKGITIPQAGEYYFKMNWYNAAERTTISLFSPVEKQIAQYYGKYPAVEPPLSLGIFKKGDNLLLSLKSSWWNTFYGPVYSNDPLNFKIETINATHWKFAFEGPLRYDKNYNDGSFEIYLATREERPKLTASALNVSPALSVLAGETDKLFTNIGLDATGSSEDISVTRFDFIHQTSKANIQGYITNIKLYDQGTVISDSVSGGGGGGSNGTAWTTSTTTIVLTQPLVIPKGTKKTLNLRGDVSASAEAGTTHQFNIANNAGISAFGQSSNNAVKVGGSYPLNGILVTVVSMGRLTLSPDATNPPSANYIGGSTNVTIGVMKLESTLEDVSISHLTFASRGLNGGDLSKLINKLYLYDGSTKIAEAIPTSTDTLLVWLTPGKFINVPHGSAKTITIKADFNQVGPNYPAISGSGFILTLPARDIAVSGKLTGRIYGDTEKSGSYATNSIYLFKSVPVVSKQALASTLQNGNQVLYRFNVFADAQGDIGLYKFSFDTGKNNVNLSNFELFEESYHTNLTRTPISSLRGNSLEVLFDTDGDGTSQGGEYRVVPAGSAKTYELRANVQVTNPNDYSLTVKLLGNAGEDVPAPASASNIDLIGFGHFIWSDLSYGNSSSTATTTAEWVNGRLVKGLDQVQNFGGGGFTSNENIVYVQPQQGEKVTLNNGKEEQQLRERIKKLELKITDLERQVVETEKRLTLSINTALAHRVKGEIFLQTEEHGEAWYVDPVTEQRFYLKDGESAYRALQAFGLGISDANLRKIPVGLEERAERN
ncbi:MAG: CARDB domain-containing protein, partial [Patescibacteria group bacterium]